MEEERVAEEKEKGVRKGLVITDGDLAILRFIHDYRLVRICDLELLTGRKYQRLHGRLKGLFDHHYLGRLERPLQKDIYYIRRPGLGLLLSQGLITDEEAERRVREGELKSEPFLAHELMLAGVHLALELAARQGPLQLVSWREGEAVRETFKTGFLSRPVTIQPDAVFQLEDTRLPQGKNCRMFYLEADRSTMPIQPRPGSQRFLDKIERYCQFFGSGRPFALSGSSIRILTLTLTNARRDNLAADTHTFLTEKGLTKFRKYFLFGSLADVSPNDPATLVHLALRRPGDSKSYPLSPVSMGDGAA
jgi:hypothetical protein